MAIALPSRMAATCLREQPLGVAREHGGLADVAEAEVQHNDTLEANTTAAVGKSTEAERVNVVLGRLLRDAKRLHALLEQAGVVHTLSTRHDLLTTDHDVERVAPALVVRVRHRVERTHGQRELVEDVEVRAVLLLDEAAEPLLVLGREVVLKLLVGASLLQHLDTLLERHDDRRLLVLKRLERVLLVDDGQLLRVALREVVEDVDEQVREDLKHLVVVRLDGHLEVEAHELAHVAVGVRVLGAEDGADLVHAFEARDGARHLLVQLRALRERGILVKVLEREAVGTALGRASNKLGRVDLDEAARVEELAEELADGGLRAHDGLVGGRAQVERAVVEARVEADVDVSRALGLEQRVGARGVLDLERQVRQRLADNEELLHAELDVRLRGAQHGARRHRERHERLDDRLLGDRGRELDHLARHGVALLQHGLDRRRLLAQHDERDLGLGAHRLQEAAHPEALALQLRVQLLHGAVRLVALLLRLDQRQLAVRVRQLGLGGRGLLI